MEQLSTDYTNYLVKATIQKEIKPICSTIDEMLARLDEFENLLIIMQNNASLSINHNLPNTFVCENDMKQLCQKIDSLEKFLKVVNVNIAEVEHQVELAEENLGYNDTGLKGFLKPLLGNKPKPALDADVKTQSLELEPINIFKASDYF